LRVERALIIVLAIFALARADGAQAGVYSKRVPPGSTSLYGFADNNYPNGPIAVTDCSTTITVRGSSATATTTIGFLNTTAFRYAEVNLGYSIVAVDSSLHSDDETGGGGSSMLTLNVQPFEYRQLRQVVRDFPVDRLHTVDGIICSVADVAKTPGENVHYPTPTDYGDDKAL
jgi:hypothetical protein